ncbi:amidohydrolase family protein [Mangrovicoccus ximenensis]|uniref:hypothetical protein n=1 Tax=Mangrovicoccus ximenensis TaxID=1911570 RepID=UPI000D336D9F|nr:hypothetical protein [Mangrovicoccus ximenensis]
MPLDLIISGARLDGRTVDIGFEAGRIAAIEAHIAADAPRTEALGALAFPGFADSHIHLDKACILERCAICEGTLAEAISGTAAAKAGFTVEDIHARAAGVLAKAVLHGTNRMRSFAEVDPRAGMRCFEALSAVKAEFAHAVDLDICVFAQEGLTQEMDTHAMLDRALAAGADLVGGCPYADPDPERHIALVFDLAEKHGTMVDFHLDFDLDPTGSAIPAVLRETEARKFGGRVSIGHVSKLSAMAPGEVRQIGRRLADAGVALTALPGNRLAETAPTPKAEPPFQSRLTSLVSACGAPVARVNRAPGVPGRRQDGRRSSQPSAKSSFCRTAGEITIG